MDYENVLRSMPKEIRDELRKILDKYDETYDVRYAEMAIELLERFEEEPAVKELVRKLRR